MARSIRAMLAGVAVAGLVAFGAGAARAQDLTVMTSVPGLDFPFFVHMMKAMQDEGDGAGRQDGRVRRPELGAQADRRRRGGGGAGRQRHRHQPDRRQRHGAGDPDGDRQRRAGGDDRPARRRGRRHHRPCRRRQRQGRRGAGRVGDGELSRTAPRSSTCRASPAPARRSTATRACTTSSTRTRTSTSSWPSRPPTSPATRACR